MKLVITSYDVTVDRGWISVTTIGRIGLYKQDIKAIGLDYSMKWIAGSNDDIPCRYDQIKDKIVELINNSE